MTASSLPLSVRNLTISLPYSGAPRTILQSVHFDVQAGEILGVVGESGSGKSTLGLACLGLLPALFRVEGDVRLNGNNIREIAEKKRYRLRGHVVGYVPQEPMKALNPGMTIEQHVREGLPASLSKKEKRARVEYWLSQVGLEGTKHILQSYPFALSGGQRQRVLLAAALAAEPEILIADEFTTALDPVTRYQAVELIKKQVSQRKMAAILISHDLELVARSTDRMLVLRKGVIVESGETTDVITSPTSRYMRSLLALSLHFTPREPLSLFPQDSIGDAADD